jgi:hypothetical protein
MFDNGSVELGGGGVARGQKIGKRGKWPIVFATGLETRTLGWWGGAVKKDVKQLSRTAEPR